MNIIHNTMSKVGHHLSTLEKESIMAIAGIAAEYYSIFIYGYFSPVLISQFFSTSSPLILFSALLLNYLTGPLGAIFCGHIGDTRGRKRILIWTLSFIAIPPFLISMTPTYAQIGIMASVLFILFRVLQTFAFGGDTLGLITFVLENVPGHRRGLFAGLLSMGASIGAIFASLSVTLLNPLQNPFLSWTWRLPLSIGIFGMLISIYFYRKFGESTTFKGYKKTHHPKTIPVLDLFKKNKRNFLKVLGITSFTPIITIIVFAFIPHLGVTELGFSFELSMWFNTLSLCIFSVFAPLFGALSDRLGRRPVLFFVSLLFLSLSIPFFLLLRSGGEKTFLTIQVLFSIISSAYYGTAIAASLEQFPTHIRYTGTAFGYYLAYALCGGINGTYIVEELHKNLHTGISPVIYLIFGSIIAGIATIFLKERYNKTLPE